MTDQIFPEPTVGVFIFNKANELLLLKSHKWPGKYVIPGGHVELGETLEETAIREAREETGLDIYDLKFICFQEFIHDPAFWKKKHFIFFDYFCRADSLNVTLNDEAQEHIWVNPKSALDLEIDSYTHHSLEKILEGNHF
jgi:nucleoside triphosphatase